MKKLLSTVFMVFICVFTLVACSKDESQTTASAVNLEQASYVFNFNDIETNVSLEYTGDRVVREVIKTTQPYEALGVENKEAAKEMLESQSDLQSYDNITGIIYNVEYTDSAVIQTVDVNFDAADLSELSSVAGLNLPADATEEVSFSAMDKVLQDAQFEKQ